MRACQLFANLPRRTSPLLGGHPRADRTFQLFGTTCPPLARAIAFKGKPLPQSENLIGGIDNTASASLIVDRELQEHPGAQKFFKQSMRWADMEDEELDNLMTGARAAEDGEVPALALKAAMLVASSVACGNPCSCCNESFRADSILLWRPEMSSWQGQR